jgi:hypothetical protein
LAADDRSWEILLADLQLAYEQLKGGETVRFAPKTTSFKQWAQEYPSDGTGRASVQLAPLPLDFPEAGTAIHDFGTAAVALHLDSILGEDAEPPELEWHQLALNSASRAIAQWAGTEIPIDVLNDVRNEPSDTMNLSRTVGPLTLGAAGTTSPIAFGFMDQSDIFAIESCLFERPLDTLKWKRAHAGHLEIFGSIAGRQLQFEWAYSKQHFLPATIEQLAAEFVAELGILIKASLTAGGEYAADSYLDDFNWEQRELDKVRSAVNKAGA